MSDKTEPFSLREFVDGVYNNENSYLNFGVEVNKCLFKMYDYLLEKDQIEKENKYTSFEQSYEQLSENGKRIIKEEWLEITKLKKEKVKRKGDR